jgi:SH3-like domain-containing protein
MRKTRMKKGLLALALIVFSTPAYSGGCLNEKTFPEKTNKPRVVLFRANDVNLRSGAGVRYCAVRVLSNAKNKPVEVIGKTKNWRYIRFEDKSYWLHQSMLKGLGTLQKNAHLRSEHLAKKLG